jgi:hypothetical protein
MTSVRPKKASGIEPGSGELSSQCFAQTTNIIEQFVGPHINAILVVG